METAGGVMNFHWQGEIPSSKSLFNRALIVKSYFPRLQLHGFSDCQDVLKMKSALEDFSSGETTFDCGDAGTTFRFLAFRASRNTGSYLLKGSHSLMSRPHEDLISVLKQFDVFAQLEPQGLRILSNGWTVPDRAVVVPRGISSQFASGLLLNCWDLDRNLDIEMVGDLLSESYFQMTIKMLQELGMHFDFRKDKITVNAQQACQSNDFTVELDMSSAFSVAAAAAIGGEVTVANFEKISSQPDSVFPELLKKMNAQIFFENGNLKINKSNLSGIEVSLENSPDLFPVLSILCAFAVGKSQLIGAPHLIHKESNRIAEVSGLLTQMKIKHEKRSDGLIIDGAGPDYIPPAFQFDPKNDHRMAMAAGLVKMKAPGVEILNPACVDKSFPGFWEVVGQS